MSEMEREARNRAARLEPIGAKAQPVSEMEREARNRAARLEPTGAKAQPVSEMEREAAYGRTKSQCAAFILTGTALLTASAVKCSIHHKIKVIVWRTN